MGVGHSGEVTAVKISPDGKTIVSVSADGAILRWRFPEELQLSYSGEVGTAVEAVDTQE